MLLSAEISEETEVICVESEEEAERTLLFVVVIPVLAVERDAPKDEDALRTLPLVVVMFVLAVASDEPSEDEAPSTVPLTVVI